MNAHAAPPRPTDADALSPSPGAPAHQRASGAVRVGFRLREGRSALHRLYQEGSAKLRLPRALSGPPEAVFINTAGGLTGGDRFATAIACADGSAAVFTTQACERVYRSAGGDARLATSVSLGAGAALHWLPQETILFDGGRLSRRFDVDMAADATLLAVEAVIFGRMARAERVREGFLRDRWRVRRGGALVFADDLCFAGPIAELLARPAVLNGGSALATVLLCAPDAARHLDAARAAIGEAGGASAWDGKLVARLTGADGFGLRQRLLPLLAALTGGRALPKVWQL